MTLEGGPRGRRKQWLLVVIASVVLSGAAGAVILSQKEQTPGAGSLATVASKKDLLTPGSFSYRAQAGYDDGGYGVVTSYILRIKDRRSLEHIRDCYQGAGYRGVRAIQQELDRGSLAPPQQLSRLQDMARLYLFEGEFLKAAEILKKARALIEADPEGLHPQLPSVLFLQGVAALRRGETENCVECGCESSCIFPILPRAVHQKPEGSRQAIQHFTEFLQILPEDVGVRWLLNVAYMTLGEYPDHVPPTYLIPLDTFQSEFDIGRFIDIAPQLGLNRLNMSGGAIMDDFDNDGLLDIVVTTSDESGPMAFYRNKGDGTFEDRTRAAGLEKQLGGLYCVQTDYNNDGWLDIYVARGGWKQPMRHSLLRNNRDGTFTDVTKESGLDTPVAGQVAVWADYDNDGWLDLFVGSEPYVVDGKQVFERCRLYHNRATAPLKRSPSKPASPTKGSCARGPTGATSMATATRIYSSPTITGLAAFSTTTVTALSRTSPARWASPSRTPASLAGSLTTTTTAGPTSSSPVSTAR